MNSSTLRRLAADHAALHHTDLPPNYCFPPCSQDWTSTDDLTQLVVLLTGPQETPYSRGLWKLSLKIPEDYPKSPPKATFRTRIWHPNVEETTGSVCVDTLKRDWDPSLTLRDVLVTISCLLIHPNPQSALNAAAGHLLQDDYDQFARQARLMTSIHAKIPANLKEVTAAAKERGEDPDTVMRGDQHQCPSSKDRSLSSSSLTMKTLPQRITNTCDRDNFRPPASAWQDVCDEVVEDDDPAAFKENDPMLSPTPVTLQSPRRPTLTKRPLSDLPIPTDEDLESQEKTCTTSSGLNMPDDRPTNLFEAIFNEPQGSQLTERNQMVNFTGRGPNDSMTIADEGRSVSEGGRPPKRICSDEAKENAICESGMYTHVPAARMMSAPVPSVAGVVMTSGPGSKGHASLRGCKARTGLRRL